MASQLPSFSRHFSSCHSKQLSFPGEGDRRLSDHTNLGMRGATHTRAIYLRDVQTVYG